MESLKSIIFKAMNIHIPKLKLKSSPSSQWFNSEINHLLKCTCTLRRKHRKHPTSSTGHKLSITRVSLILMRYRLLLTGIANAFNQYFYSIFTITKLAISNYLHYPTFQLPTVSALTYIAISKEEVLNELLNLNTPKSMEIDGLVPNFYSILLKPSVYLTTYPSFIFTGSVWNKVYLMNGVFI